jgi:hypothetical protein
VRVDLLSGQRPDDRDPRAAAHAVAVEYIDGHPHRTDVSTMRTRIARVETPATDAA